MSPPTDVLEATEEAEYDESDIYETEVDDVYEDYGEGGIEVDGATGADEAKPKKPRKKRPAKGIVDKELMPAIVRLYRFLYTGNEDGLYVAGVWSEARYYKAENVTCVAELVVDIEQAKLLVEAVRFVKASYPRVEPCVFALALAISCTDAAAIKALLYSEACKLLADCDEFFLFIHHLSALKTGTGAGWKRFVASWYKSIPPPKLAEMVGQAKGALGWTHKDVLKLTHGVKLPESHVALNAILCYVTKDLAAVEEKFSNEALAAEVLATLRVSEQVKRCQDPAELLGLVRQHRNVGPRAMADCLMAKEIGSAVWSIILERLPIEDVLLNIHKLHTSMLLFSNAALLNNPVSSSLKDFPQDSVEAKLVEVIGTASRAPPLLTYIVLSDYEAGNRRMNAVKVPHHSAAKKAKINICASTNFAKGDHKEWDQVNKKGEILPPNPEVITALKSLLARSLIPKAEAERVPGKYLVTMDLRDHMFKSFQSCNPNGKTILADDLLKELKVIPINRNVCFWNNHTSPGNAAVLLALYFSCHVAEVSVAVFTNEGVACVSLEKEDKTLLTLQEAVDKLKTHPSGTVSLSSPVEWAQAQARKFDLFVNVLRTCAVTTRVPKERRAAACNPAHVLHNYQREMDMPHAGIVNISLGRRSNVRQDYNQKRILDIFGLDENIPNLIQAFAHEARDKL